MGTPAVNDPSEDLTGIGSVPAGGAGSPSRGGEVVTVLMLAGAAALLLWALWVLRQEGVFAGGTVLLGITTVAFLGLGHLALRLAGVREGGATWLGLRYVVGFALSAFLITLVAGLGLGTLGLWLAVAAGAVGWGVGAWQLLRRDRPEASGSLLAGELLAGAALLRVAVQGTSFWRSSGSTSIFTQYRDLLYHLALVRSGIERGLPLRGWVLESGVPRPGYHPAFDTTASVLIKGLQLPVDAGFFRLILPLTLLAMLVGLAVLAGSWAHSRHGSLLVLGFVGLTLIVAQLPGSVTAVIGDAGLNNLRYFVYNPPSTLSTVAATACLAIVALASERRATGAFVLAGLLAGATVMMKANFAIVLVPAFVLTLGLLALFHRRAWSTAVAGIAAAALASAAAYPTTLGPTGGALALSLGRLGPHLLLIAGGHSALHSYSALFTRLAGPLARHGQIGDALLVLLYVLVAPLGVWLLVTALASWRARAVGERPFGRSPTASLMVLVVVGLSIVAALVVAQRGFDYTQSWNITWHTIQNLWWLGLCAAAVAVDAALATVTRRHPATAQTGGGYRRSALVCVVVAMAAAVLLAFSLHDLTSIRQTGTGALPSDLRALLQGSDTRVPVNARIVQRRYTRTYNWISALAGRGAVLERSSWTRLQYPVRTAALEKDIAVLYSTPDAAAALRAAHDADAGYAVLQVRLDAAPGLRKIGTMVARRGDWALLRLP